MPRNDRANGVHHSRKSSGRRRGKRTMRNRSGSAKPSGQSRYAQKQNTPLPEQAAPVTTEG